jgi:hypothetical protein
MVSRDVIVLMPRGQKMVRVYLLSISTRHRPYCSQYPQRPRYGPLLSKNWKRICGVGLVWFPTTIYTLQLRLAFCLASSVQKLVSS